MISRTVSYVILAVFTGVNLVGCMPTMTVEEMRASMPQRPIELDKLEAFAGRWETVGEAKFAGVEEVIKTTGTSEAKWDGDRWFLVNRGVFGMSGLGEMTGLETWTYDSHSKKYRSTWVDSMGYSGIGTAKLDEDTNTWYMRATSYTPRGKLTTKGEVKFIDESTMEWTWTEYALGGLMKTMEMTGTSRRQ